MMNSTLRAQATNKVVAAWPDTRKSAPLKQADEMEKVLWLRSDRNF